MAFNPLLSAYVSPLTDEQHARLGRIAVLWGYADYFLDFFLQHAIGLTFAQHNALVRDKSFGAKLETLKNHLADVKDEETRDAIKMFRVALNNTKTKRNQAFHGAWGWRGIEGKSEPEICARHHTTPHNPAKASDLPKLEADLCSATALGMFAFTRLNGAPPMKGATRFLHGNGSEPPPEFEQWLTQHPLSAENLDCSWSEGELPRLVDPLK